MINGVEINSLRQIPDNRGTVKHFVKADDVDTFAECYITTIYSGIIKGWHGYVTKTIHYCVPYGMVKLVLFDGRKGSITYQEIQEIYVGTEDYKRITIPPGVYNAFQGISPMSLIVVVANEVFDESRTIRLSTEDGSIPYDWTKINK